MKHNIDDELRALRPPDAENWARLTYLYRRHLDAWTIETLKDVTPQDFRMSYMPFLMNISLEGNSNNEIAERAGVTKQAMSKVTKELEAMGLISVKKSDNDARSVHIHLTRAGKTAVWKAYKEVSILSENYKQLLGEKDWHTTLTSLAKILHYHETQETKG